MDKRIKMKPYTEILKCGGERALLQTVLGTFEMGFIKDGMVKLDGSTNWRRPEEFENFILISDLKNYLVEENN
jgi:hypothetical protein